MLDSPAAFLFAQRYVSDVPCAAMLTTVDLATTPPGCGFLRKAARAVRNLSEAGGKRLASGHPVAACIAA